jgi:hypothetical protein
MTGGASLIVLALTLVACSGDDTSGTGGGGGSGATTTASTSADGSTAQSSATGSGGCAPFVVDKNDDATCSTTPGCTVLLNGAGETGVCTTTCEFDSSCLEGDRCYIETVDDGVCLHACSEGAPCEAPLRCEEGTCRP